VKKAPQGKTVDQIKESNLTLTTLPNNISPMLPGDVLSQIFSFLDGKVMVRCQQVSKEVCAWMKLQPQRAEFIEECTITRTLENKSWKIKTVWKGATDSCFALNSKIFWISHQVIHALDARRNKYETYPFEQKVQWICPWTFIPNCIGILLEDHFEILDLVAKERHVDEITDFTWMEPTKCAGHKPLPTFSIKLGDASYKVKTTGEVVLTTQNWGSHTFFLRNYAQAFSPYNSIEINHQRYTLLNSESVSDKCLSIGGQPVTALLRHDHHWFSAAAFGKIDMSDSKFQHSVNIFDNKSATPMDNHLAVGNQKLYWFYNGLRAFEWKTKIDILDLKTKKLITSIPIELGSANNRNIFIFGTKLYLFVDFGIREIDFG
jgi:hypothetical protein